MKVEPVSIEVTLKNDLTMRGYEWPMRGAPVVLLHDYDDDLDAWREIDRELAEKSFRVINLELRGHGFSDGEPDRDLLLSDVQELLKELGTVWGPIGLCTYGSISATLCSIGGSFVPKVHIAVSPLLGPTTKGITQQADTSYLVISGAGDQGCTEQARSIFDDLGPKKLWASVGSGEQGPKLLRQHRHLVGDMTLFFQRYLVPMHQEWQEKALDQVIMETEIQDSELEK
jgi:hypothetical protein